MVFDKRQNQKNLIEYYESGRTNKKLRDKIIQNNLNLVYSEAKYIFSSHNCNHQSFEDLYAEGCIGLIKAVETYDPTNSVTGKPNSFSSIAIPKISGAILQYLRDKSSIVRIAQKDQELLASKKELSLEQQQKLKEVKAKERNIRLWKSIDSPIGDEDKTTLKDLIPFNQQNELFPLESVNWNALNNQVRSFNIQKNLLGWYNWVANPVLDTNISEKVSVIKRKRLNKKDAQQVSFSILP